MQLPERAGLRETAPVGRARGQGGSRAETQNLRSCFQFAAGAGPRSAAPVGSRGREREAKPAAPWSALLWPGLGVLWSTLATTWIKDIVKIHGSPAITGHWALHAP